MSNSEFTYEKPNEQLYLRTLITYLASEGEKYLASLLKDAKCTIQPSSTYSQKRWNALATAVYLQIPVEKLSSINEAVKRKLTRSCDRVMPKEIGFDVVSVEFSPLLVKAEIQGEPPVNATYRSVAVDAQKMDAIWDVFICHASEDKDEIARPLADALSTKGLKVWYDEFTLTLGDSLSRKIDEGLAKSRFGIVILSPSFFNKPWPRTELEGLRAKEISSGKTILPIWHNVDHDFVVKYSPVLADKLAVSTDKGLDKVVDEILKAISKDRSKAVSLVSPPSAESTGGRNVLENMGAEIPVVRVKEEVTVRGTHLSMTLLWCKETAICVHGPYLDRFYAFTAKPGMKFVVIAYKFQNNWKREQTTPYLKKGEITTHRGYIYSVWDPPAGAHSDEYGPREATDEETKDLIGTSGAFEKLLPEESCVGCVTFEIPKDATPAEAVLFEVPLVFRFDK